MKVTLPEGYQAPDNAKPGEPFEVVATLVQGKDGGFELTAIDGIKLEESGEEEEYEESPMKMPWDEPEQDPRL